MRELTSQEICIYALCVKRSVHAKIVTPYLERKFLQWHDIRQIHKLLLEEILLQKIQYKKYSNNRNEFIQRIVLLKCLKIDLTVADLFLSSLN